MRSFLKNFEKQFLNIKFKGRTTRKEFLFFMLGSLQVILFLFLLFLMQIPISNILPGMLFKIASFIYIAVSLWLALALICAFIRRLHDMNISGWYYFLLLMVSMIAGFFLEMSNLHQIAIIVPCVIAVLVTILVLAYPSNKGANNFGETVLYIGDKEEK